MASERLAKPQRVFFALCPDAPLRSLLSGLAAGVAHECGGRPTAPNHFHLTLAFLGDQPQGRVEALHRVGAGIHARAFALALDTIGGFPRSGIAWLGASAPQPDLVTLHGELAATLGASGFVLDGLPYVPHLTLARRSAVAAERRLSQPIGWRVSSFVLVLSERGDGGRAYRVLAEWPLAPD